MKITAACSCALFLMPSNDRCILVKDEYRPEEQYQTWEPVCPA